MAQVTDAAQVTDVVRVAAAVQVTASGPAAWDDGTVKQTWAAPSVSRPLDASVGVPGSKSMTNRALVLAALAAEPTTIRNPLRARDTALMAAALGALGAQIADVEGSGPAAGPDLPSGRGGPRGSVGAPGLDWVVTPGPVRGSATIDCGLAGTVMRFVPPVAALADGDVAFDGDPYARQRPMGPVLDALRQLGVLVDDDGRGTLPFVVRGTGHVQGGAVEVDASASSQFMSALLLSGACYDDGVEVRNVGAALPSLPHVEMSAAMLTAAGVTVDRVDGQTWRVHPGRPSGGVVTVEPDVSNALPFAAAALATRGRVRIVGFPAMSPFQPAGELVRVLTALGAVVTSDHRGGAGLVVDGSAGVHGADLDLSLVGELTPVLAALACLADSPSVLRGVAHLRGHETDRLAALVKELGRLGADIHETEDGLAITPRPLTGGVFETYDDHRLATAAAVLGLAVPGVQVVDVATTAKTLPGFVDLWTGMLSGDLGASGGLEASGGLDASGGLEASGGLQA